jgi:hypothetical protein
VATAEALGRFGQQGLDYAFYWGDLKEQNPNFWAFRAFRNFDGKGGRFQDISMPVRATEHVSLFASRDAGQKRVVLVLVNRDAANKAVITVTLPGCAPVKSAQLFSFSAGSKALSPAPSQVTKNGVSLVLEPYSFASLDLALE